MTIKEIVRGESKNVEFKAVLPANSEKYIKTIVAFANTQGGKLIIGVDDKTRDVIGVDDVSLFQIMDSISNAVSDSCEPQIVPNIEPQTVDGKTIIVITVAPEPNRPYYLKTKGKDTGTYIRVAGTSRPAHPEKIRELEMEGARISWDELTCIGYEVTEDAIEKLCTDITKYREETGLPERKAELTQLQNWKLLKKEENILLASNAFVLMTSDYFQFSRTQCAVFKGTERSVFLDKREFTGPVYEQIEEAVRFVLRNIRLGATIDGLVRKEKYELPVTAVREMIVNAHCHRNLSDSSCVQVAVYDDRLEVTSPGGLYNGLTYEELMNGHSKIRNRALANVFSQMGIIESWGTGIRRIMDAAGEYGLPEPEFLVFDDMFRVNLYRNHAFAQNSVEIVSVVGENKVYVVGNVGESNANDVGVVGESISLKEKILQLIRENEKISAASIGKTLSVATRTVERNIKELREEGKLFRHGTARGGYWEVL